jgi:hypothetical protein
MNRLGHFLLWPALGIYLPLYLQPGPSIYKRRRAWHTWIEVRCPLLEDTLFIRYRASLLFHILATSISAILPRFRPRCVVNRCCFTWAQFHPQDKCTPSTRPSSPSVRPSPPPSTRVNQGRWRWGVGRSRAHPQASKPFYDFDQGV